MSSEDSLGRLPRRKPRKLLVATLGLASLSLVGCGGFTSGNLVAPPPEDTGPDTNEQPDAGAGEDSGAGR